MLANQKIGDLPDRITQANDLEEADGRYVLAVLNRALRGEDNAVLESAIAHANARQLPLIVYTELLESVPYASDRIFYFALGAFRALAQSLAAQNIQCVQSLHKKDETSLLKSLISNAAVIYTDEDYTHWDRDKLSRLLHFAQQAVFSVDAARLIPTRKLPKELKTTPAFRKAHSELRDHYAQLRKEVLDHRLTLENSTTISLPTAPPTVQNFANFSDDDLKSLIANCDINHDIAISKEHPPTIVTLNQRIDTLKSDILARYKWIRNNPALEYSTSELSPYLHFGMVSPHHVLAEVEAAEVPKTYTWKFRDEFLTWREWSHYQAFYVPNLHEFEALPDSAKQTLLAHAEDERPEARSPTDIRQGNTPDTTWNAAQREWLNTGWLHNNLRMYWAKQILRFTDSPQQAWKIACELNDTLSLDGRDPATYASMQWAFGNAKPGYSEKDIYGWVAPKSDRAILKRKGMKEWIEERNHAPLGSIAFVT